MNSTDHDQYLVGGQNGYLGGSSPPGSPASQQPDPATFGALRFTNGRPFGNQQRGAIVSSNAYATSAGIQVTFKTVTYGGTGADGISFYLMDGCVPVTGAHMPTDASGNPACTAPLAFYPPSPTTVPAIGATGGSLAYSCSNNNGPGAGVTYDGLTGAYLGLGIDEYGNFLNQGDNTATGYGFQPGRIGLRGAGAISWPALNSAYGANPNSSSMPFYPRLTECDLCSRRIRLSQHHLWCVSHDRPDHHHRRGCHDRDRDLHGVHQRHVREHDDHDDDQRHRLHHRRLRAGRSWAVRRSACRPPPAPRTWALRMRPIPMGCARTRP